MAKPKYMAYGGRGYDSKERFYNADEGLKVRHTAGPWSVVGGIVIGNGYELADCRASYVSKDESLANAHLIASAPELLEALKGAMCGHADNCLCHNCGVIKRAEGRS